MAYLVRTRFEHTFAVTKEQAEDIAHQYLAEMVRDDKAPEYLWAKVIDCQTITIQTITAVIPTSHKYIHEASGKEFTFYHTQYIQQ